MRRLISLFSEPFDGYAPSRPWEQPQAPAGKQDPPYFLQLMESLKHRHEQCEATASATDKSIQIRN